MNVNQTVIDLASKRVPSEVFAVIPFVLGEAATIESVKVTVTQHAYRDIAFIDLVYPEGSSRFAVHNKFIKEVKKQLNNYDLSAFDIPVMDDEFAARKYKGAIIPNPYSHRINRVHNVVNLTDNTSIIDWNGLTDGDFEHAERRLTQVSTQVTTQLKAIGELIKSWPMKTKTAQVTDLYWSLDVEDHKIFFCLDNVPVISKEGVSVDRTHVTPEIKESYPAEDQVIIGHILRHIDIINGLVAGLVESNEYNSVLFDFMKAKIDTVLLMPFYHQVYIVLPFNPGLDEGLKMVENEVSEIIEYLEKEDQLLDVSTMIQFTIEDGVAQKLNDTFVSDRWSMYTESFGKAVDRSLALAQSPRFKTYSRINIVK